MASPLSISRLTREEFKDAPAWINPLLSWLNQLMEQLAFAQNGQLTFEENLRTRVKTFSLLAGAAPENNTSSFTCDLKVAPKMLFLGRAVQVGGNYTPITAAVSVSWRYESGMVYIMAVTGLTAGQTYDLTVLLA